MKAVCILILAAAAAGGVFATLTHEKVSLYQQILPERVHSEESYRMIFLGDIMLARDVERKMATYGRDYPFSHMASHFDANTVVGNFEAAVPEVHVPTPSMTMQFSVPAQNIPALAGARITHLSLANNHTDDYGKVGFAHTKHVIENTGITPFGSPFSLATTSIAYIETEQLTIALLGIYAVEVLPSTEVIEEVMWEAEARSDFQVVYVHWGNEYELVHSRAQEQLAHRFVDAGADLVVGHHPHVVQDVEVYNEALIFYSLGNFIFDQYFSTHVMQGLVLDITFDTQYEAEITLLPVSTEASRTAPQLMNGYEREAFLKSLADRSSGSLRGPIERGKVGLQFQ
ncbi:MAG: CapA family protein [Candidatus Paceibacterota bacterium]